MEKLTRFSLIFSGLLGSSGFASAQTAGDTLDAGIYSQKVVVTASKIPESRGNVTQQIDVLSPEGLQAIPALTGNLAEALQFVPGNSVKVLSRNDANWGAYGGIGPKYSTFMLGGLPIDAFTDVQALRLSAIDRIEIQRGPASVLYPNYLSQDFAGNQSPLTGTVNLILKEVVSEPRTVLAGSFGSFNTLSRGFSTEQNLLSASVIAGGFFESSDYTNYGSPGSWLNMTKDPEYRKEIWYGGLTLPFENQKVTFFANRANHSGDAGREHRKFENQYDLINAGYSVQLNEGLFYQINTGIRYTERKGQEDKADPVTGIRNLDSENGVDQHFILAENTLTWEHFSGNTLSAGADFQLADYQTWSKKPGATRSTGNKAEGYQVGFYAQEEVQADNLVFRGGIRINHTGYLIDRLEGGIPGEKEKSWTPVLWSAGMKVNLSENASVFANAGSSFMAPGLKSVGGTLTAVQLTDSSSNGQVPNKNLKPESGIGIDGGMNLQIMPEVFTSIRGFYTTVTDAIVENSVSQNPSRSQSVNAGTTTARGVEAEIRVMPIQEVTVFSTLTWTETTVENPRNPDQDGSDVPFVPDLTMNGGATVNLEPLNLILTGVVHYSGKIVDSLSKKDRQSYDQGLVVSLSGEWTVFRAEKSRLNLTGSVYNLTDNQFDMPWQFKDTGRALTAGLQLTF